jgi:hypothetical protein
MAIILPLVSYNPTSLILGLSNNPKDGLVEVPFTSTSNTCNILKTEVETLLRVTVTPEVIPVANN